VTEPLQVIPSPLRSYLAPQPLRHPVGNLWSTPQPSVLRGLLQGGSQFLLLFLRKQHRTACGVLTVIANPVFPPLVPAPNDRAHPSGRVAELLGNLLWRLALLRLPQNVPVDAFDRVLRATIATIQLFCCQIALDFDSLSYTS
jgi:hypothetical protein